MKFKLHCFTVPEFCVLTFLWCECVIFMYKCEDAKSMVAKQYNARCWYSIQSFSYLSSSFWLRNLSSTYLLISYVMDQEYLSLLGREHDKWQAIEFTLSHSTSFPTWKMGHDWPWIDEQKKSLMHNLKLITAMKERRHVIPTMEEQLFLRPSHFLLCKRSNDAQKSQIEAMKISE
jgi:hypothetical protein